MTFCNVAIRPVRYSSQLGKAASGTILGQKGVLPGLHPLASTRPLLGFHTPKVAASGTLLGGDPIRIDWRSNLANRLANEEAQLDWRLPFLALGIFHCSGNPLVGPSHSRALIHSGTKNHPACFLGYCNAYSVRGILPGRGTRQLWHRPRHPLHRGVLIGR